MRTVALLALVGWAIGCASPPPARKPLLKTEAVRMDREIGPPLAKKLEESLPPARNADVTVYLRKLAETLMFGVPDLEESPVGVFLFRERGGVWQAYSVPGARIYLPTGIFRHFEYEGQVAAMIAVEIAHLYYRLVTRKVELAIGPDRPMRADVIESFVNFPGFKSLFVPSATEFLRSVEKATSILYAGGVDPRGMESYLELLISMPDRSPVDMETLREGIERARRVAISSAPILSPIIRSDEFLNVQRKFEKL